MNQGVIEGWVDGYREEYLYEMSDVRIGFVVGYEIGPRMN